MASLSAVVRKKTTSGLIWKSPAVSEKDTKASLLIRRSVTVAVPTPDAGTVNVKNFSLKQPLCVSSPKTMVPGRACTVTTAVTVVKLAVMFAVFAVGVPVLSAPKHVKIAFRRNTTGSLEVWCSLASDRFPRASCLAAAGIAAKAPSATSPAATAASLVALRRTTDLPCVIRSRLMRSTP
jgi:hypothetical protein